MHIKNYSNYIGNSYQLFGTRHYTLSNGKSDSVHCIDVKTGSGFEFTVVPSRGLDISLASYKGINLVYQSPCGETHPLYYRRKNAEWLYSFFGGLLTTCGPANIGKATADGKYGLHDRFSNTPIKNLCDETSYSDSILIKGEIDFGALCMDKIHCLRTIEAQKFSSSVKITDVVTNYGSKECDFMFLYHTNYGYPLLTENSKILFNSDNTECYDDYSAAHLCDIHSYLAPNDENNEKNYFHKTKNIDGYSYAAIVNPDLNNLSVLLKYSNMPYLTECKIENPVDYFLGIEPSNTLCIGKDSLHQRNIMPKLKADESKIFTIEFSIFEGVETTKRVLSIF